ncbi:hypothetical protein [Nodularia spumigena]|uniref:hypothetical protein n=1 Tax=Nodularia spumigena TaxID=70799 RepID=UPI0030D71601
MRKSKSFNIRQSIAKSLFNTRTQTHTQPLQVMSKNITLNQTTQDTYITNELEIDIALSFLNACKYVLAWIICLCIYSSM